MTESEEGSLKVLLEEMNDKFSLVLEGHDAIRQEFKDSHRGLEEKINLNSSLIKFGFKTLDAKIDGVRTELRETRNELKEEIQGVRIELRETREELSAKIETVGTKVDGHEDRIRFLERKVA